MNITDKRKMRLLQDLQDKDYRSEYVSSSVDVGVASQIRALREQRNWNQTKLADEANMHQARISVLENPSHSPTLETLKKLAIAFDVALMVRFVPFSDLVKWKLNMSIESLEAESFHEEEFFKNAMNSENAEAFLRKKYYQKDQPKQKPCDVYNAFTKHKDQKESATPEKSYEPKINTSQCATG